MKYETPSMVLVSTQNDKKAVGPECCSTKWSGCCYKE